MIHASLFSGIGGFDYAAEEMGWENLFHCEWNPFGQSVLKYYWPNSISYHDITKTNFTIHRGTVDVLTGGFPCQPYSQAGKRKGKEDERHLWPEMRRAIREIQPGYVVGENVFGLINWNRGLVFHEVQAELEAEGYEVFAYVLPAAGINAPHERYRVWFVAYSESNSRNNELRNERQNPSTIPEKGFNESISIANSGKVGLSIKESFRKLEGRSESPLGNVGDLWKEFPTQSPICNGNDGISDRLDHEAVFKVTKKTRKKNSFENWREESLKAGGNAIVPGLALQIFKAIEQYEILLKTS